MALMHYGSHRHTECGLNDTDRTLKDSDTLTLRAVDVTCLTCRGWLPIVAPEFQRKHLNGPASGAPDAVDVRSTESIPSESTGTSPISRRTENGLRLHDQHCAWCDCEEFAAVQYGSLHHLSERAVKAVSAAVTLADTEFAAGRGAEEIIEIDEDGKVSGPLPSGPFREP